MTFNQLPNNPTIPVAKFEVHIPQADIDDLQTRLARPARHRRTWENTIGPDHLGVNVDWLHGAVAEWRRADWRQTEREINSFPNFKAKVDWKGETYDVHFVGLFSGKKDAIPVILNHGWPGSFLEFLPMLRHLSTMYMPAAMPYHFVVPSLVGYGFSSPPTLAGPFGSRDCAGVLDGLMRGLGFGKRGNNGGYFTQGGDIGSFVSRCMSELDDCLGIHLNFFPMVKAQYDPKKFSLDAVDLRCLDRADEWETWGLGYMLENATKPATIGIVLESDPVAMLAWIGEKFLLADIPDQLKFILAEVSLFWYTNTAATCTWHYRNEYGKDRDRRTLVPRSITKPMGYTQCIFEIYPTPIAMVKAKNNVVFSKRHLEGGHFLALEKPALLWNDIKAYLDTVAVANQGPRL